MKKLENKTVFITGGLSGIGKACAIAAANEGAAIVIADRERGANINTMDEIKAIQPEALFIECNVSIYEHDSMLGKIGNLGIGEGILCLDDTARKVRIPKKNEASN